MLEVFKEVGTRDIYMSLYGQMYGTLERSTHDLLFITHVFKSIAMHSESSRMLGDETGELYEPTCQAAMSTHLGLIEAENVLLRYRYFKTFQTDDSRNMSVPSLS